MASDRSPNLPHFAGNSYQHSLHGSYGYNPKLDIPEDFCTPNSNIEYYIYAIVENNIYAGPADIIFEMADGSVPFAVRFVPQEKYFFTYSLG